MASKKNTPSKIKIAAPKGNIDIDGVKVSRAQVHGEIFKAAVEGFGAQPTAEDKKVFEAVNALITKVKKPSEKIVPELTPEAKEIEQRIAGQRRMFSNNLEEFKKTMWGNGIERTLDGFTDLIALSVEYPMDISKRPAYIALRDAFYRVMGSLIIVPTEDLGHAFALERGVEDMLREYVYNLHSSGKMACRIRFVKAKDLPVTDTPLYQEITIKFGAKYSLRLCSLHYRY